MRHEHRAGEKLFVDYAGHTVAITDCLTGEIRMTQIFVEVLGASNYTYAEVIFSQQIEDWIGSHVRAFDFLGDVPEVIVPDNLKSGDTKACRYEPVALPARVRQPRAKAEAGVLLVERWILAKLRKHTFFTLADLNQEVQKLPHVLNNKPFKKLPGSRKICFEELDKPALKTLPAAPYELAYWKKSHRPSRLSCGGGRPLLLCPITPW